VGVIILVTLIVNVISRSGLLKLAKKHPATVPFLIDWYRVAKKAGWHGLREVRREYPSADQVGDVLIFDILGHNFRLITRVNYGVQRIYVKAVLNHREYDRKEWMKWA
jgi:mRNA interferase HigB